MIFLSALCFAPNFHASIVRTDPRCPGQAEDNLRHQTTTRGQLYFPTLFPGLAGCWRTTNTGVCRRIFSDAIKHTQFSRVQDLHKSGKPALESPAETSRYYGQHF